MSNTAEVINFPIKTERSGGQMADLANGYTKIANEIQKLKPRLRMSGREWQCLEAVIWLTYGWNKKQDRVTNTVIAELTDLGESHISDTIKSLAERKIIFAHKQGVMKIVGINTELSEWILDKPKTGKLFPESGKVLPKTGKLFPESGKVLPKTGKPFPETGDTQYKNKNNSKRSSSSRNSKESRNEETLKFLSRHPEAADGIYTPAGKSWGTADDLKAARWIFDKALTVNAFLSEPNWVEWANTIRLMRLQDKRTHYEICELFKWANENDFWQENILCPSKLRKQWDQLTTKRLRSHSPSKNKSGASALDNTDWIDGVLE
ncbi:replication protein [Klebsiella pneumoniae]